jgi:hypothetical protein
MPDLQQAPSSVDAGPAEPEQRRHDRHVCLDGGVLRLAIRPVFGGRLALLLDVSLGGLGLLLPEPLESGTVLAVELGGPAEESGKHLARVVHCEPHSTPRDAPWLPRRPLLRFIRQVLGLPATPPAEVAWRIGCQFNKSLSEDELQRIVNLLGLAASRESGDHSAPA